MEYSVLSCPLGELFLTADKGSLMEIFFSKEWKKEIRSGYVLNKENPHISMALNFLEAYFNRADQAALKKYIDKINLNLSNYTAKEALIYSELMKVRFGQTITYSKLAERCGIHSGARFAGNSMAKNRFPIIIPCHRVIKADGSMGNYSGGIDIKKWLLAHEGSLR